MADPSEATQGLDAETSPSPSTEPAGPNRPSGTEQTGPVDTGAVQASSPSAGSTGVEASGTGVSGAEATATPPVAPGGDPAAATSLTAGEHPATSGTQAVPASGDGALPQWLDVLTDWLPQLKPALHDLAAHPTIGDLIETVGNGGPVLIVLALLSVAAMTIVLVKLWQFARLAIGARQPVERALALWYRHQPEAAIAALVGRRQPGARLVHRAMTALQTPDIDEGVLREELTRFGLQMQEQLRGGLRALEVIATLSPLLGLLGTVLGMIEAFRELEQAGSRVDPSILSGGIWQALLTTAVGLAIAIPVVMLHAWLERKVNAHGHRMDDAVTRVLTRDLGRSPLSLAKEPKPVPTAGAEALDDAT